MTPQAIVDICKLTGDYPISLIFGETDYALTLNEPFRSNFLDDARTWLVGTDLDQLVAQVDRHRERVVDGKRLIAAALDGHLKLLGAGTLDQVAVVRGMSVGISRSCAS